MGGGGGGGPWNIYIYIYKVVFLLVSPLLPPPPPPKKEEERGGFPFGFSLVSKEGNSLKWRCSFGLPTPITPNRPQNKHLGLSYIVTMHHALRTHVAMLHAFWLETSDLLFARPPFWKSGPGLGSPLERSVSHDATSDLEERNLESNE